MKTIYQFIGIGALLLTASVPAQEVIKDENITFTLDTAAITLDWAGQVQSVSLSSDTKMFMIRDTKGLLAITQYPGASAANKAFADSGAGNETKFHGFQSLSRPGGGSITWVSDSLVFSVGSGAGEAEILGDALFKAAVGAGIIKEPDALKNDMSGGEKPNLSAGDSVVLEKLKTEYSRALQEGVIDEAAEMARANYKIDYRATVAKAATGEETELANLFAIGLDGAAAEIHAEVLYRLKKGLGDELFNAGLSKQASINQNRVNEMIAHHRENMGGSETAKLPSDMPKIAAKTDPGNFLVNGNFEGALQLERGSGTLVKDSDVPGNQVLAFASDDYLERPMSIPADVNGITVSLRVMIPPSIRLENLEPGKPASGVKIRVRNIDKKGNSGIAEWVVQPSESWQELTTKLKNIGASREKLSLEASWFEGKIYLDDIKVTSLFPEFLPEVMYEHYQTPAQVTYIYVVNPIFNGGNVTRVGSPEISDNKVTIDFDFDGQKENLWFVEKKNDGKTAEVVVGLPNAGGDLYHLEKIEGRWAITGIDESDGI